MMEEEKELLNLTGEIWNKYLDLPILHPNDQQEFMYHLHAIQRIIMSREFLRNINQNLS